MLLVTGVKMAPTSPLRTARLLWLQLECPCSIRSGRACGCIFDYIACLLVRCWETIAARLRSHACSCLRKGQLRLRKPCRPASLVPGPSGFEQSCRTI